MTNLPSSFYMRPRAAIKKHPVTHQILLKSSNYYARLNERLQGEFLIRTIRVHKSKRFFSTDHHLTFEQEIWLASIFTQLSFGLQTRYWLPSFEYVRIHQSSFYSPMVDADVNGLTINESIIHLSWKHVLEGEKNATDGRHVAIHEFAHALYLDIHDFKFYNPFSFSMHHASKLCKEDLTPSHIFSKRKVDSPYEFWAVSIEFFFENPQALLIQYPEYYKSLVNELKQDPLSQFQSFPFFQS